MLQQGPELTQDAPASANSESAEPENPSEMPEPPDVDMTETDVSDGSSGNNPTVEKNSVPLFLKWWGSK